MLHLYDRATMAEALTRDLDPALQALLHSRIGNLAPDLIDYTEYLVIEPGDTEADIVRHIGFSPLVEPIEGARFGQPNFHSFWDWLGEHDGWFELIVTFGSTFCYTLLIQDAQGLLPDLRLMCRNNAT
ncbi:hypothetical protein [Sphingomonas sp. AAP5]|uniref:hypothetical protein n=1 Tax=Sphingomonas sp. AAP5 TaxID=1523415 RepID=UPI0019D2E6D3|nr:hypothetical protein [Sphingomonas sp. AAP5]